MSFRTLYNNIPLCGYSKTTGCYSTWLAGICLQRIVLLISVCNGFSGKFGCNNHSRKALFCRTEFSKQVVLLWPQKLHFVLTKVTCRMLAHRSGWPLFRMAKDGPGNLTTNVSKHEESENQVHQGQNDTGGSTTV